MTFIIWPKEIDETFRPAYANAVSEVIQDSPRENDTHYVVGSSRIQAGHIEALQTEFPAVVFTEGYPEGFDEDD